VTGGDGVGIRAPADATAVADRNVGVCDFYENNLLTCNLTFKLTHHHLHLHLFLPPPPLHHTTNRHHHQLLPLFTAPVYRLILLHLYSFVVLSTSSKAILNHSNTLSQHRHARKNIFPFYHKSVVSPRVSCRSLLGRYFVPNTLPMCIRTYIIMHTSGVIVEITIRIACIS
jgi:hypothetical protein